MNEKTIDILTADEVKQQYNLTPNFLRNHGKAMGAFNKPRRWARDVVERYLRNLAEAEERKRAAKKDAANIAQSVIKAAVRRVKSKISPQISAGDIQGMGGRGKYGANQEERSTYVKERAYGRGSA